MQEGLFGQDDLMPRSAGMYESDEARSRFDPGFQLAKKKAAPAGAALATYVKYAVPGPLIPPPSRT